MLVEFWYFPKAVHIGVLIAFETPASVIIRTINQKLKPTYTLLQNVDIQTYSMYLLFRYYSCYANYINIP